MTVSTCNITGILYDPDNSPIVSTTVRFYRQGQPITPLGTGGAVSRTVSTTTDGSGNLNVDLERGAVFLMRLTSSNGQYYEEVINVPTVASADIADALSTGITSTLVVQSVEKTADDPLALADAGKTLKFNSATAVTLTIPPDSDVLFDTGTMAALMQTGAGSVTVAGGSGVTVNAAYGLTLPAQWSAAVIHKDAANTWILTG